MRLSRFCGSSLLGSVLGGAKERILLGLGLEATVSELGAGIDELEIDLLESNTLDLRNQGLAENDDALHDTGDASLEHDVVLVDLTVLGEATQRSDSLDGQIGGSGSVGVELAGLRLSGLTDAVDLLVHLGTMMVTILTVTRNTESNTSRMPSTDTSNLTETTMSLTRETSNTPTRHDTGVTATLGDSEDIDHIVLREYRVDRDLALEEILTPINLLRDGTTIDLNLHQVSLLLSQLHLADLRVSQDADSVTVLLHTGQLVLHVLVAGISDASSVAVESLLLALVPVLVEATLNFLAQVLSPDGGQSAKTTRSLNISNQTDNDHGRSLDNGDSLNGLPLVQLGTRTVDLTENVSHTSLVAHERSQVARLGGVILGE